MELYKKHRPKLFKHIIGQDAAVKAIQKMLKSEDMPHCILLSGPSGCGKTTIARILKDKLGCSDMDFKELNAANYRGVETVREIEARKNLVATGGGKCRIHLIDEAHQLSKDAQNAFLKLLEDGPGHVYFILATTDPGKLLPTIRTRSTEIKVRSLKPKEMIEFIESIVKREKKELGEETIEKIADHANGSPRKALVLLHQVINLETEEDQLEAVVSSTQEKDAFEICKLLLDHRTNWAEMAALLSNVDLSEPEGLRHLVMAYMTTVLLSPKGRNQKRASMVSDFFGDNFFDSKKNGFVNACYQVITADK